MHLGRDLRISDCYTLYQVGNQNLKHIQDDRRVGHHGNPIDMNKQLGYYILCIDY